MSTLAQIIEREGRGSLPRENMGLPSLDVNDMQGISVPNDWDITGLFGDILMCEIADGDGQNVMRGGILVSLQVTGKVWRVAKVIMKGPLASSNVNVGDYVMYPSDRGIPMIGFGGKNIIFINEERLFCKCEVKDESVERTASKTTSK